jgi:hypothetical protein
MTANVIGANLKQRAAVLSDSRVVPITNMLDEFGEETDDPSEVVSFVCFGGPGEWLVDYADNFEAPRH